MEHVIRGLNARTIIIDDFDNATQTREMLDALKAMEEIDRSPDPTENYHEPSRKRAHFLPPLRGFTGIHARRCFPRRFLGLHGFGLASRHSVPTMQNGCGRMNTNVDYSVKPRIKRHRAELMKESEWHERPGLYISEHIAQRITERHMQRDIPIIGALIKRFYADVFMKTTYSARSYRVSYRKMSVCFKIFTGAVSEKRQVAITTTFEGESDYYTDETIILK